MSEFMAFRFLIAFLTGVNSLKIWLPNTNINNSLNWDKHDTPKDCDEIHFEARNEIATLWNLEKIVISGLSLPETGDLVFRRNVNIQFRDKEKCSRVRDLKFIRNDVKGWLDPDNWKSDSDNWLPHVERVPCAGEPVLFPPRRTFAVQLPSVLVPVGEITFDNEAFRGDAWSEFLRTDLGLELFKGADDVRGLPWRNGDGCVGRKCICGMSTYAIRDGLYKEVEPRVYEEAVCLYAMPKCEPSDCYSPVVPEGHCCGICGAVIKLTDKTKEGLNVSEIKQKIENELQENYHRSNLKTYVGRTKDENIQIVVIADSPEDTIKSHSLANHIQRTLTDQKLHASLSSRFSGLKFSNYVFNSVSGVVFGTLIAVVILFVSIFYIYVILPKKKFYGSGSGNPFVFARFDNTSAEENLEIGVEPGVSEPPQAFDNPMYTGNSEVGQDSSNLKPKEDEKKMAEEDLNTGTTDTKEYSNPVYCELEKAQKLDKFGENPRDDEEEFTEIKF